MRFHHTMQMVQNVSMVYFWNFPVQIIGLWLANCNLGEQTRGRGGITVCPECWLTAQAGPSREPRCVLSAGTPPRPGPRAHGPSPPREAEARPGPGKLDVQREVGRNQQERAYTVVPGPYRTSHPAAQAGPPQSRQKGHPQQGLPPGVGPDFPQLHTFSTEAPGRATTDREHGCGAD